MNEPTQSNPDQAVRPRRSGKKSAGKQLHEGEPGLSGQTGVAVAADDSGGDSQTPEHRPDAPLTIDVGPRTKSSPSRYRAQELSPAFQEDPTREKPAADRGTLLHEAFETGDLSKIPPEDEEGRLAVKKCMEYAASVIPVDAVVKNEFTMPIIDGDKGRLDRLALKGNRAWYLDPKFAVWKQEPVETNPAAQAYAYAIMQSFTYVTSVEVHYLYPFLDYISIGTYARKDLPRIKARIRMIKERAAKAVPATCNYSDETCLYCRFLSCCPTAAKVLLPVAKRYAETHEITIPEVPDFSLVRDPKQWQSLMRAAPVLEACADSIKRHALEFRVETGMEIPGYDLVARAGRKKIAHPLLAREIANQNGVSDEQFMRSVEVSMTKLLDAAKEGAPHGDKSKAAQRLENALYDAGALEVGSETQYLRKAKE